MRGAAERFSPDREEDAVMVAAGVGGVLVAALAIIILLLCVLLRRSCLASQAKSPEELITPKPIGYQIASVIAPSTS